jgi:hypothetical protein
MIFGQQLFLLALKIVIFWFFCQKFWGLVWPEKSISWTNHDKKLKKLDFSESNMYK